MKIELTAGLQKTYRETAKQLKGSERRKFMARIVNELGGGGLTYSAKVLGWDPKTIRKGRLELVKGVDESDAFGQCGRKRAEARLPSLLEDLQAILDGQSQIDPTFRTQRLYTRLTVAEVRQQLIAQKGYADETLPHNETLRLKINALDYTLKPVQKSQPQKKFQKPMRSSSN
jgi:hypothetical protein